MMTDNNSTLIRRLDVNSGFYYFENIETGETFWDSTTSTHEDEIFLHRDTFEEKNKLDEQIDEASSSEDSNENSNSDDETGDSSSDNDGENENEDDDDEEDEDHDVEEEDEDGSETDELIETSEDIHLLLEDQAPEEDFEEDEPEHPTLFDNLGNVPILIPLLGIITMIGTIIWSCTNKFDCLHETIPTLSYAATFRPQKLFFTTGMCLTALLIFATVLLYTWYLKLNLTQAVKVNQVLTRLLRVFGFIAAISLFLLAILDMRNHHDAHVSCTIIFFIGAWLTIVTAHLARRQILRGYTLTTKRLRNLRVQNIRRSYKIGSILIKVGMVASFLFAFIFISVNHIIPNFIRFDANHEAIAEYSAIICQLLYMGSLSSDLSYLSVDVENQIHMTLVAPHIS